MTQNDENTRRQDLIADLRRAAETCTSLSEKHRDALNHIAAALETPGGKEKPKKIHTYEHVFSTLRGFSPFSEALLRISGMTPKLALEALEMADQAIQSHNEAHEEKDKISPIAHRVRRAFTMAALECFKPRHDSINPTSAVSVNVSYADLETEGFATELGAKIAELKKTGIQVVLEILEDGVFVNGKHAKPLRDLAKAGATFALDDYGAKEGHHGIETIRYFLGFNDDLIIKLDGEVVREALKGFKHGPVVLTPAQQRLRKIVKDICLVTPNSRKRRRLVCEWVRTPRELHMLETIIGDLMPVGGLQGRDLLHCVRHSTVAAHILTGRLVRCVR